VSKRYIADCEATMDNKNQNHIIKKMVSLPGKKAMYFVVEDSSNPNYIELNGVKMLRWQFEQQYRGYKVISTKQLS
jgi:hypothetical protein